MGTVDSGMRSWGSVSVATVRTGTATWRRPAILLILLGLLVVAGAHPEAGSGLIADDHGFVAELSHAAEGHEHPDGDQHEHAAHPTAAPAGAQVREDPGAQADSAVTFVEPANLPHQASAAVARQPAPPGRSGRQRLLDLSVSRT